MLGKISADNILIFFLFFTIFPNLHEISKPIVWEKLEKNNINLSSAELAKRMVKVKRNGVATVKIALPPF